MTTADGLFVFVGAGVSVSAPSNRPAFNKMRDEILCQLDLNAYAACSPAANSEKVKVVSGLAPEPFMLELSRFEVAITDWLNQVLGEGDPNAAHVALAALAHDGAKIWTVNFDLLIERADSSLSCIAWPDDPSNGASIMKPHGTIGGELIVTSEQVLRGLGETWVDRLREDTSGRTVVFIGYSGRDLDFQPIWDDVLTGAEKIIWFDKSDHEEQTRKRLLLRRADAAGKLSFPLPTTFPSGLGPDTSSNPSWDFVNWCHSELLTDIDEDLARQLLEPQANFSYPHLSGNLARARPAVLGLLGDYRGVRSNYLQLLKDSSERKFAARSLVMLELNQGGKPLAIGLALAKICPPLGPLRATRETAERKRLTVLSKSGNHRAVLRGTKNLTSTSISTLLILRSASTRITGSLDEAAELAKDARGRAVLEKHPVRVAHASFQQAIALLWAERLDEAQRCLEDDLVPYAAIAASRWVAWADFIRGGLAVRAGDGGEALQAFELSRARFAAERLVDGLVSVAVSRLAALRLVNDDVTFKSSIDEVSSLVSLGLRKHVFYAKAHEFTYESIKLEQAEFDRMHINDLQSANRIYSAVSTSRYPLHAAHALLGLSLVELQRGREATRVSESIEVAHAIGAQLITQRAELIGVDTSTRRPPELFFC
jgi:hypothetical protein